jgi:hypothetical protein
MHETAQKALLELMRSYFSGKTDEHSTVIQGALRRFGKEAVHKLFDRLNQHHVPTRDLVHVAALMDADRIGIRELSVSERLEYLFGLVGLTSILKEFNDKSIQRASSQDEPASPIQVCFAFRTLPEHHGRDPGYEIALGNHQERSYGDGKNVTIFREIWVDLSRGVQKVLLEAVDVTSPEVSEILEGIRRALERLLKSGGRAD